MSMVGENVAVMVGGSEYAVEATKASVEKPRVSRKDRRLVRAALVIMALLAVADAVLYIGRFV